MSTPDAILPTYQKVASDWARARDGRLFEKAWLDRLIAHTPLNEKRRRVLDLGCGSGRPIATYLSERGAEVTGVDGAPAMVQLFESSLPSARAIEADMRELDLGERFDAILAWDSFFHLSAEDQRRMFGIFAAHADRRAALMFTSGNMAGEAIGEVEGEPVFHASLDPEEYRQLMQENGFEVVSYVPEDPQCEGHTVWLARFTGA